MIHGCRKKFKSFIRNKNWNTKIILIYLAEHDKWINVTFKIKNEIRHSNILTDEPIEFNKYLFLKNEKKGEK